MGNYITKSPKATTLIARIAVRAISSPVLYAVSAVTLGALCLPTAACGQYDLLPQFSNTVTQPMHSNSRSVNMKLSARKSATVQASQQQLGRPQSPRLGMKPKSYLSPTRFRRQDGDVFGEDQAGGGNPFGEPTVESPIKESPFEPFNPMPIQKKPPKLNPFGEPEVESPAVDPTPRTPLMDTTPTPPKLPPGGEFTPDPNNIPGLPTPFGDARETERAGTERSTPDPDEIGLEDFNDDNSLEERDPKARRTSRTRGRRDSKGKNDRDDYDDPRRPFRSNVYRPARDPSYYSKPTGANPYAAGALGGDPNGFNPYAANPYLMNPYAANPYPANPNMPNPYAMNPYAMNPYRMNPYAGYGCPPGCGCASCPPTKGCQTCPPVATSYAGCPQPTPAVVCDDGVYETVVDCQPSSRSRGMGLGLCRRSSENSVLSSGVPLYYVSIFGGWSDLSDLEIEDEDGRVNLLSANGSGFGAAIGQIQGRNLRSELEVSYRNHDIEDLLLTDFGSGSQRLEGVGDIESFAGMLNIYWEFVDLFDGPLSPYIGAGAGAVNVSADMRLDGGQDAFTDGEDSSFAYQYIVGMNYKLQSYSDLFIEYRHFAADSLRLDSNLPAGSLVDGDGELNYQTNNIFFGMRLKF